LYLQFYAVQQDTFLQHKNIKASEAERKQSRVHSFLAFRGFELCGFGNSRGSPKNKNTSLEPFNGQEHQNCSTARTDLRATPRDAQGAEGKKEAAITMFLQRKEKHYKILKHFTIFIARTAQQ
jgi:hypothetical protein